MHEPKFGPHLERTGNKHLNHLLKPALITGCDINTSDINTQSKDNYHPTLQLS